jgi:hypothetical protein
MALAFPLTPVFVWRWTHTRGYWIILSMTSILKVMLWMFQKMCISEFDISFVTNIYLFICEWYHLKLLKIFIILIIIFIIFRLMDIPFLIITKYYLSQQSQHQHFLTSWWFSRMQWISLGNIELLIVTKYYLSQQPQHQYLLMIFKNAMNIFG